MNLKFLAGWNLSPRPKMSLFADFHLYIYTRLHSKDHININHTQDTNQHSYTQTHAQTHANLYMPAFRHVCD